MPLLHTLRSKTLFIYITFCSYYENPILEKTAHANAMRITLNHLK